MKQHRLTPRRITPDSTGLFLATVTVAGSVVAVSLMLGFDFVNWPGMVSVTVAAAIAERYGLRLFTQTRVSASATAMLSAGFLFGPAGVVIPAVAASLSAWVSRDKPVSRLVFNASTLTLSAVAAAYTYAVLAATVPHPASIIAGAAGGAVAMWLANTLLVGTIVSLSTDTPFRAVVRENYAWLWTHFIAMGLVALALAMVWDTLGAIGVIAFVAPVAAVMLALREGAEQARDVVLHAEHERVALRSYDRLLSELDERDRQSSPLPDLPSSRMARAA